MEKRNEIYRDKNTYRTLRNNKVAIMRRCSLLFSLTSVRFKKDYKSRLLMQPYPATLPP
jgi:hypothetical protein